MIGDLQKSPEDYLVKDSIVAMDDEVHIAVVEAAIEATQAHADKLKSYLEWYKENMENLPPEAKERLWGKAGK